MVLIFIIHFSPIRLRMKGKMQSKKETMVEDARIGGLADIVL